MNKTTQTSEMENQKEEKKIVNGVSVTNLFQMVETIKTTRISQTSISVPKVDG